MKILYFSPSSRGGIADYAHEQANALCAGGADVTLLCTPKYLIGREEKYRIVPILVEPSPGSLMRNKALKAFHFAKAILLNSFRLADFIEKNDFKHVLFGTYAEYMAPLWAWRLRRLAKNGVTFGAIVHDPVRDFVVGPLWWHRWSIAEGYSFLREAFVHGPMDLETVRPMPRLRVTPILHGPYPHVPPCRSSEAVRSELDLPAGAKLMLAFGHIHPRRKNIDLVIRALSEFPDMCLIVAGEDASPNQQVITSYRNMAIESGVADRCRWKTGFIPSADIAELFVASDVIMLTYKKTFHSASGVLSTAVSYCKPCIASGGPGALKTAIENYDLGIWTEPDDLNSLKAGIRKWREDPPNPQWERYAKENSWGMNAQLVIDRFRDSSNKS